MSPHPDHPPTPTPTSTPARPSGAASLRAASAGIGLKPQHYDEILSPAFRESRPAATWFEVHPENYMVAGGPMLRRLSQIAERHPISLHAVGLSLGTTGGVSADHLTRLVALAERFKPVLISDHLSWNMAGGVCLPDLLPLPYTAEALNVVTDNVNRVQDALGRRILIENPSLYLLPKTDAHAQGDAGAAEAGFLADLAGRTGCGILLDVNNLFVCANNVGHNPMAYIAALPTDAIGEFHLAGHKVENRPTGDILVDDHGSTVVDGVWDLYRHAVARFGPQPTLVEWDTDVPPLSTLLTEAEKARGILAQITGGADDRAA